MTKYRVTRGHGRSVMLWTPGRGKNHWNVTRLCVWDAIQAARALLTAIS